MQVTLYIGNLALTTTEAGLRQLFSQAGAVDSVSLIKEPNNGPSKGFAFVTMATQAAAEQAIAQFHGHALAGRKLTVNIARARESGKPRDGARQREPAKPGGYQSRLGAFNVSGHTANTKKPTSGVKRGGYQSPLGAFGPGQSGPKPPRRRGGGGSERH